MSKLSKRAIPILIITILLTSIFSVAIPLASADALAGVTLQTEDHAPLLDVDASLSTAQSYSGSQSVHLKSGAVLAGPTDADEGTIKITPPSGFTFGDIDELSWYTYLVSGYLPHVDFRNAVSTVTVEGAYVNDDSITGWPTGTWFKTFDGADGVVPWGPATSGSKTVVDGDSVVWVGSQGQLTLYNLKDFQTATLLHGINEDTVITAIEIEVDSWVVASEAYVDDIVCNGKGYDFEYVAPVSISS